MIDNIADRLANAIEKRANCDRELVQYGIAIFIETALTLLAMALIAFALGILPYAAVYILSYYLMARYSFGAHIESHLLCKTFSLAFHLAGIYLALSSPPLWILAIGWCAAFGAYFKYAPAATKKRPIPKRQAGPLRIRIRNTFVLLFFAAGCLYLFGFETCASLISFGVLFKSFSILPVAYKLFRN